MRTHGSPTFTIILLFNHIAVPFYLLSHAHKTTSIKAAGMHSNIFCEFLKPGEPGEEKNTRVMGGNNLSKSFHLFPGLQYIPNGAFYRQNIRRGFKKVAEACK